MILLSSDPREAPCRQKLIDVLGAEDATVLTTWLWERHHAGKSPTFGDVIAAIVQKTEIHGPTFAKNLLDAAKKPREQSEAEIEIMAWVTPRIHAAAARVMGHRGDQDVARAEFDTLVRELEAKLWNMFPDKHRATMKGAIVVSFKHKGGEFVIDVGALVRALFLTDPLAATARASRG